MNIGDIFGYDPQYSFAGVLIAGIMLLILFTCLVVFWIIPKMKKRAKGFNVSKQLSKLDKSKFKIIKKMYFENIRRRNFVENIIIGNNGVFVVKGQYEFGKISKNEREKIIHKENYEQILKAIKNEMQITVFLQNGKRVENLSVYAVASAKEEMFNYVLVCQKGHNITFRLNNIKLMYLQSAKAKITNANKILFDKQIECGVQYPFYNTDDKPIKVVFSEEGKHMFEKIYLYRPTPTEINGNEYTFNCSAKQMIHYLQRFGSEAVITAPKKLGIFMRNHYHFALKKYKEFYKKD